MLSSASGISVTSAATTAFGRSGRQCTLLTPTTTTAISASPRPPRHHHSHQCVRVSLVTNSQRQFGLLSYGGHGLPSRSSTAIMMKVLRPNTTFLSQPFQPQQRRTLFIQTDETPNPESLKFLPGRAVLSDPDGNGFYVTFQDKQEIQRSPLAQQLFQLDGVKSVYLGQDFVTITKFAEAKWIHLRLKVFEVLMDFFSANLPVLKPNLTLEVSDTTILDTDDDVVAMIKELLEARIRPAVQEDGGDIRYVGFDPETGIVSVKLAGSCVGCPSSSVTLKQGVENMMMHYIPEVTAVVSIEDDDGEGTEKSEEIPTPKPVKTYEERLAAAGIPFSD